MEKYILTLELKPLSGFEKSEIIAIELDEVFTYDHMKLEAPNSVFEVSFTTFMEKIKKRGVRKDYLISAAKNLALRLSERIEDKEGWNGTRRQQLTKDAE